MKTVIAFALFIAAISAAPKLDLKEADLRQPRIVTNAIESAIDDLRHLIRDNGFDPLDIEKEEISFEHDIPSVKAEGVIEGLLVLGLSNIQINNLSFNVLTTRLSFDLELPEVRVALKDGKGEIEVLGHDIEVAGSGFGSIKSIRVRGNVRVNVGIISGISIRDLTINFTLGKIEADVNYFKWQGEDQAAALHNLLNYEINKFVEENAAAINELLEAIVLKIANEIL